MQSLAPELTCQEALRRLNFQESEVQKPPRVQTATRVRTASRIRCSKKTKQLVQDEPLALPEIRPDGRTHYCYILYSARANKTYIGYTVDFPHRLRQHNGELAGGAKRTQKWRPWLPLCLISGFPDNHTALSFEYRLQHARPKRRAGQDSREFVVQALQRLIIIGMGLAAEGPRAAWPCLQITWFVPHSGISHPRVTNTLAA